MLIPFACYQIHSQILQFSSIQLVFLNDIFMVFIVPIHICVNQFRITSRPEPFLSKEVKELTYGFGDFRVVFTPMDIVKSRTCFFLLLFGLPPHLSTAYAETIKISTVLIPASSSG